MESVELCDHLTIWVSHKIYFIKKKQNGAIYIIRQSRVVFNYHFLLLEVIKIVLWFIVYIVYIIYPQPGSVQFSK